MNNPSGGNPYGVFPPNVIELIQRQLSQFGRVGATKIQKIPALSTAIPAAPTGLNPVSPAPLQIREPGTIIGMYGQEQAGTNAKFATTEVRIQIGGQEDLFTDGQSGVFMPMLALFPPGGQCWFPLWRRAVPGVNWVALYRNTDTGATATPTVAFAFIADADIQRAMPPSR